MVKELQEYTLWLVTRASLVLLMIVFFNWLSEAGKDDSDPPEHGARSGLGVHTDALTGCQYLSYPKGGLVARYDSDGDHVGCRLGSRR